MPRPGTGINGGDQGTGNRERDRAVVVPPRSGPPPPARGLRAVLVDDRNQRLGRVVLVKLEYIEANRVANVSPLLWVDLPCQPVGVLLMDDAGAVVWAQRMTHVDERAGFTGRVLVEKGHFQIPVRTRGDVGETYEHRRQGTGIEGTGNSKGGRGRG